MLHDPCGENVFPYKSDCFYLNLWPLSLILLPCTSVDNLALPSQRLHHRYWQAAVRYTKEVSSGWPSPDSPTIIETLNSLAPPSLGALCSTHYSLFLVLEAKTGWSIQDTVCVWADFWDVRTIISMSISALHSLQFQPASTEIHLIKLCYDFNIIQI